MPREGKQRPTVSTVLYTGLFVKADYMSTLTVKVKKYLDNFDHYNFVGDSKLL